MTRGDTEGDLGVAFLGLFEVVVTEEVVDDEVPEAFRFFAFEAG